jgi:hypothetical protein
MVNDDTGLQADFMPVIHGVRSFAGLKSRATRHVVGGQPVLVASDRHLEDLIARRLALPVEKRMNFLRRRLPGGGSCL